MPPPRVYITVSRSGQTLSPCTQMSSAVLAITLTRVWAPVRSTSRSSPCRKRAPPTPPESTVTCAGGVAGDGEVEDSGISDMLPGKGGMEPKCGPVVPNTRLRLDFRVRQACNHTSVISNSVRQDRRVEEGRNTVRELYLLDEMTEEDGGWQERGLCAQTDPEAFFPEKGGSTREAKKVCLTCDVRQECLEYALENDERFGIWGGLSERERRKLKKRAV